MKVERQDKKTTADMLDSSEAAANGTLYLLAPASFLFASLCCPMCHLLSFEQKRCQADHEALMHSKTCSGGMETNGAPRVTLGAQRSVMIIAVCLTYYFQMAAG